MTRFDYIKALGIVEEDATVNDFAEAFSYDLDCGVCGVPDDYCKKIIYGDDYETLTDDEKDERSWGHTCEEVLEKYLLEEVKIDG